MKNLTNEINFETLRDNFDSLCDQVKDGNNAVTLTLKSGRKAYIISDDKFNDISHFVISNASSDALTL
jgi:PHD/YefM family antitoxin component YafN of YafNO toxin-antitoxin module